MQPLGHLKDPAQHLLLAGERRVEPDGQHPALVLAEDVRGGRRLHEGGRPVDAEIQALARILVVADHLVGEVAVADELADEAGRLAVAVAVVADAFPATDHTMPQVVLVPTHERLRRQARDRNDELRRQCIARAVHQLGLARARLTAHRHHAALAGQPHGLSEDDRLDQELPALGVVSEGIHVRDHAVQQIGCP